MSLGRTAGELTANEAHRRAKRSGSSATSAADELNYSLSMRRLLASIGAAADRGETLLVFSAPWMVLDGTTTDPVMLARQLCRGLVELGYRVDRYGDRLVIDWELDLHSKEAELGRRAETDMEARRRRDGAKSRRTQRRTALGSRPAQKVNGRSGTLPGDPTEVRFPGRAW
jgi:hypothetical protein